MNDFDYFFISRELSHHHALFYKMWELGHPIFSTRIPTAAVSFNKNGQYISFEFNPDYWKRLTDYERQFVICHECLHVLLNHGIRSIDSKNYDISNKGLDVVVNHMLVNRFGFDRSKLTDDKKLCWVDTIWPGRQIPEDESFEYYIQLFSSDFGVNCHLLDDHSGLSSNDWKDLISKVGKVINNEDREFLEKIMDKHFQGDITDTDTDTDTDTNAGNGKRYGWIILKPEKVIKKKWETVIKKWSKKFDQGFDDIEQWARTNRRFAALSSELMIPTEMETEVDEESKIEVWFFQDTSGSCSGFAERFFKAASSLNPNKFDVKMHCFDTKVYETTLKSGKLYGFGGTHFQPIENYIQNYIQKNKVEYPKAIFVITDGYSSDDCLVEIPNRWYWFLSSNYRRHIPDGSNIYLLSDYE